MGLKDEELPMSTLGWKKRNYLAYRGQHPSIELVRDVMDRGNLKTPYQVELALGLADCTVKKFLLGMRPIPARYWHLFYEYDDIAWIAKHAKKKRKPVVKKKKINLTNKSLIDEFRQKLTG